MNGEFERGKFEGDVLARLENIELAVSGLADKLEPRVSSLEAWRYKIFGASTVLGAVAGFLARYL